MVDRTSLQVLVLEDNAGDRLVLGEVLAADALSTFQISSCDSLDAALALLRVHPFDAIALDLSLAGGQDLAVFQELHRTYPHIPQIVLAGVTDEAIARQALQAGAQDYLVRGETMRSCCALLRKCRHALPVQKAARRTILRSFHHGSHPGDLWLFA
jgi:two-component system, cell cycle sensor histidine kinase and response regulator CckA